MKNDNPLISIIIPVYNVEKYLRQCLDSIIHQTYKNLEIIIVDDGSPDNCPQIIDEYAKNDSRIRVIHKENGGLSSARNAGLDICKGDYISFVDSDDMISKYFVGALFEAISNNDADIAQCDSIKFKNDEEQILSKTDNDYIYSCNNTSSYNGYEMIKDMYARNHVRNVVVWNKLYKKSVYENIRFPNGKINEDEYTTYVAFEKCNKTVVVNDTLYFYRNNPESIMGRTFNCKRFDVLDSYEERKKFFKEKGYIDLYKDTVYKYQSTLKEFYLKTRKYIDNNKENIKDIKIRMKENFREIKFKSVGGKRFFKYFLYSAFPQIYHLLTKIWDAYKKISFDNKKKMYISKYKKYEKSCKESNQKKFLLLNTPVHGNLGDQALLLSEYAFLKDIGINYFEVPSFKKNFCFNAIENYIDDNTVILIHAGGYIGTVWPNENDCFNYFLDRFHNNKIIVMPQSAIYSQGFNGMLNVNKTQYLMSKCKNISIFLREQFSYNFFKENVSNNNVYLCPDIVLYNGIYDYIDNVERNNNSALFLLRRDVEKKKSYDEIITNCLNNINSEYSIIKSDTVINKKLYSITEKRKELLSKLNQLMKCEICFTDRLHGMVFAYLTHTPCIVFSNNNYKIKGVYDWIKDCPYIKYIDNYDELEKTIKLILIPSPYNQTDFSDLFSELKEIIITNKGD